MSRYQPALLGALFIGVLSSLPFVNALNVCCCLWVIVGGVLVTYLLQQRTPEPVATTEAAIQGLIAGAIGGVITALVPFVFAAAGADALEQVRQQILSTPEMPPEMRDMFTNLLTPSNMALFGFLFTVPIYAVFSMAGSLLGLVFFRKKLPVVPN